MANSYGLSSEEENVLKELDEIIRKTNWEGYRKLVPVEKIEYDTFGVKIENNKIVGLGLYHQKFTTFPEVITQLTTLRELTLVINKISILPESIGNLSSLQVLKLSFNKISSLPDSIGNLSSLKSLNLSKNQLTSIELAPIGRLASLEKLLLEDNKLVDIPKFITDLKSLQLLNLSSNEISSLPDSIGNLSSLTSLNLHSNKLTDLPGSFWKMKKLRRVNLGHNLWEGELKGIEDEQTSKVLEICYQRAPINIFISYSQDDEYKYRIMDFKENLKNRKEIQDTFTDGDERIVESQLVIFIATKNSLSEGQCLSELKLANNNYIGIIPIKGIDITFDDLGQIDLGENSTLKDKLGFEFIGEKKEEQEEENQKIKFQKFCDDLYNYITNYKREVNLFEPEERKLNELWENFKKINTKVVNSEEYLVNFKENISQLRNLRSECASSEEYVLKFFNILKSTMR